MGFPRDFKHRSRDLAQDDLVAEGFMLRPCKEVRNREGSERRHGATAAEYEVMKTVLRSSVKNI